MLDKLDLRRAKELLLEQEKNAHLIVQRDLALSKANEKLRKLDQIKSEFVSIAAHQLRTPLSSINWALEVLMNGDYGEVNEGQKAILAKTYERNNRLIQLVNDMLDVDRIESDEFKYNFKKVNIVKVAEAVVADMADAAKRSKVKLNLTKPDNLPLVIADREKLSAVIENLVSNAIKYSKEDGLVEICLERDEGHIVVSIADSGIGIPKSAQDQVFSKFFRAMNAVSKQTEGSGLGLFIVKEIIKSHKGKIDFVSEEGKGTTFTFTIPIASS